MAKKRKSHGGKRQGAGRPAELVDPVQLCMFISQKERNMIDRWRKPLGLTISQTVRLAIQKTCGRKKE